MRASILAAVAALLLTTGALSQEEQAEEDTSRGFPPQTNIAILEDAPPFSALGRFGARDGFDVDVALALCAELEVSCALTPLPAGELTAALLERRVDAVVAAVGGISAGAEGVRFTKPYVELAVRFVTPRERAADLEGERQAVYGALLGSPQADYLIATYSRDSARLYPSAAEMWIDLAMGRITAVLAPAISASLDFLATPMGAPFEFAEEGEAPLTREVAIAVRAADAARAEGFDAAIDALVESTQYEQILRRHLDRDLAGKPN